MIKLAQRCSLGTRYNTTGFVHWKIEANPNQKQSWIFRICHTNGFYYYFDGTDWFTDDDMKDWNFVDDIIGLLNHALGVLIKRDVNVE